MLVDFIIKLLLLFYAIGRSNALGSGQKRLLEFDLGASDFDKGMLTTTKPNA